MARAGLCCAHPLPTSAMFDILLIAFPVLFVSQLPFLPFVFVPISFSTSIFGMNTKELNNTGQPMWVFAVTTAAILCSAFPSWGICNQWTKCVKAPRNAYGEQSHWLIRLYLFVLVAVLPVPHRMGIPVRHMVLAVERREVGLSNVLQRPMRDRSINISWESPLCPLSSCLH